MNDAKRHWTKPELIKLGTLKNVAGGVAIGNDLNGRGNGKKAVS
ncbi:MAG: hypothetical protein ACLGHF_06040 [Alphaproteobacteria bacterium]